MADRTAPPPDHDFDWVVVGSGFGGSVAALRLTEKGYSVCVLECGRRYRDEDLPRSTWNWRRFVWLPRAGLRGILRISMFKDVTVLTGCGVGGGSLVYANTMYRAPDHFYADPQWADLGDWKEELDPHYDTAERMLGATRVPDSDPGDEAMRELADEMGVPETHRMTDVAVYFGDEGRTVPDPYFSGEGPDRTGCRLCGECMLGCRFNAKNTLDKNYLYLAERRGAAVEAEREVSAIRPLGAEDGSDGYEVDHVRPGAWLRRDPQKLRARGVVLAAGALGTNKLLQRCRGAGMLPRLSARLGYLVRTNSEALVAVTSSRKDADFTRRVAITSSFHPEEDTHIESVTYGKGGNSMRLTFTLLVGRGTRITRPLKFAREVVRRPVRVWQQLAPGTWGRRTLILLVMQTLDNSMRLRPRRLVGARFGLTTEQDPDNPNPTYIEAANDAATKLAEKLDGFPQSSLPEALANIPATAHILGGAVIGADPSSGVVDRHGRVFGYERMLVTDGAAVPANPGVNPSLTITALAEHTLAEVPPKPGASLPEPVRLSAEADKAPEMPVEGTS